MFGTTRNAALTLLLFLATSTASLAWAPKGGNKARPKVGSAPAVLWRDPVDIKTRDLFYGPGGRDHQPRGKLTFIKENLNGVNPKFTVHDETGTRWGVKIGNEAKPETAATRLVWAVGYFTNEDYYLPEMNVAGEMNLRRGGALSHRTKLSDLRLKRHNEGEYEIADWAWDDNPFVGTKELDGLKIMMELICNVDLKAANQHVYDVNGTEQRYIAADLGSSFGMAGKTVFYTKGVLKDFQSKPLIKSAGPDFIDFWRFKHIPRQHAKWIGGYLAQLSDDQIRDAFRAAGFSAPEVEGYAQKVKDKINELVSL